MDLSPQSPLSLDEAAKLCLRGLVTASTLRAAIGRGELQAEFTGKRYMTTPADIEQWRKVCRDKAKARASTGGGQAAMQAALSPRMGDGSSETDNAQLAQDAALEMARKLKEGLPITSGRNTKPRDASAALHKSGLRT